MSACIQCLAADAGDNIVCAVCVEKISREHDGERVLLRLDALEKRLDERFRALEKRIDSFLAALTDEDNVIIDHVLQADPYTKALKNERFSAAYGVSRRRIQQLLGLDRE